MVPLNAGEATECLILFLGTLFPLKTTVYICYLYIGVNNVHTHLKMCKCWRIYMPYKSLRCVHMLPIEGKDMYIAHTYVYISSL